MEIVIAVINDRDINIKGVAVAVRSEASRGVYEGASVYEVSIGDCPLADDFD